jgi:hypothetical protein
MPDPDEPGISEDTDFMIRGSFRIGNSMGQGGMRIIGDVK